MKTFLTLLAILSGCACGFAVSDPAFWPQFRGPHGSGVAASEKMPPAEFSPEKSVLWRISMPPGHSSPCVFGDRIFLTGVDKTNGVLKTFCIDRAKGGICWARDLKPAKLEKVHKISNAATASAATDGKTVYVYFGSFGLLAYDFEGKELWRKEVPAPILGGPDGNYGSGLSPILAGDKIILDVRLGHDSYLLALNKGDGAEAWKTPEPLYNYSYSTPVCWREGTEDLVGVYNGGRFTAFDLKNGAARWWVSNLPREAIATPVLSEDMIFINGTGMLGATENAHIPPPFDEMLAKYDTNKDGLIGVQELPGSLLFADRQTTTGAGNMSLQIYVRFFLRKDKNAKLDRKEWEKVRNEIKEFVEGDFMKTAVTAVRLGGRGDVTQGNVVWSNSKGVPEAPSMLLYQKRLYQVKIGGQVTCREPASGKIVFQERLGALGGYFASPVAAAGRIYAASDSGMVSVFEATNTLHVIARNDLKEPIFATPAIVEGKLYVRTAGHLYAFGAE